MSIHFSSTGRWFAIVISVVVPFGIVTDGAQLDQRSLADVRAVEAEALNGHLAYPMLRTLCDDIGPRLTGSPSEARARGWALSEMRRVGLQNVHGEPWQLPRGWRRGRADAELVAPFHLALPVAAYGWSGSTRRDGVEADVELVDSESMDDFLPRLPESAGKILLVAPRDPTGFDTLKSLSRFAEFVLAAHRARVAAILTTDMRPGLLLPHTEPVSFAGGWTELPVLGIPDEPLALIARVRRSGTPVRVRLNVRNDFTDAAVESQNIVGEILGSERSDEIVVVAAHLDSWDLGTGAIDDGFGVAAILEAARAMRAAGVRPRRTVRFVLFTGEEQGLLGSRAYVERHRAELPNVLTVFTVDWGNGPVTKFPLAGHEEFAAPLHELFRSSGVLASASTSEGYLTFTDAYAFTIAGVAGLAVFQDSPTASTIGHSGADTFDKIDERTLQRDAAAIAVSALWIADFPTRIGSMWSRGQTEEFRRTQAVVLRLLGAM